MVANIRFYSSLYAQQIFNNFFGAFVFVTFQHCYLIFNINVPTHQTSVGQGRLDATMVIKSKLKRNLINVHLFIKPFILVIEVKNNSISKNNSIV